MALRLALHQFGFIPQFGVRLLSKGRKRRKRNKKLLSPRRTAQPAASSSSTPPLPAYLQPRKQPDSPWPKLIGGAGLVAAGLASGAVAGCREASGQVRTLPLLPAAPTLRAACGGVRGVGLGRLWVLRR